MLGRYVHTYLKFCEPSINSEVIGFDRRQLDAFDATYYTLVEMLHLRLRMSAGDVIINCIGVIKNRVNVVGILQTIQVNSTFPHLLALACNALDIQLIHISTDCVFDGARGDYDENDIPNATDIYGRTKALGEVENSCVIRTSIIGEEKTNFRSLVEWVKSNKGKTVDGYTNHYWNGVTCFRLAQVIEEMIIEHKYWKGVKHVFSNVVTKAALLDLINEVYDLGITVNPVISPGVYDEICDRTLTSIRKDITFDTYDILNDLVQQKLFPL